MTELLQLNFRRRIQMLAWGRRLLWLAAFLVVLRLRTGGALIGAIAVGLVAGHALHVWELSVRRQFVREAAFPRFLGAKLRAAYPRLEERDCDLVLRGLRQFFMAHLRSGRKFVAMPSKLVDAAWHEFILHTQAYQGWCAAAFGGLLHHTPAEVLGSDARRNDGLRRTWYWTCKEESIDPRAPTRLPLLFALDAKFEIEGGYRYAPDCKDIDAKSSSGTHCGSSFGESGGGSGDADGFGGSESGGGDGGDGGSGCGGGD